MTGEIMTLNKTKKEPLLREESNSIQQLMNKGLLISPRKKEKSKLKGNDNLDPNDVNTLGLVKSNFRNPSFQTLNFMKTRQVPSLAGNEHCLTGSRHLPIYKVQQQSQFCLFRCQFGHCLGGPHHHPLPEVTQFLHSLAKRAYFKSFLATQIK